MSKQVVTAAEHGQGSYASYISGFILSVLLTITAYLAVTHHSGASKGLVALLLALAVIQLAVQLVFFLHLGRESKPRWKSMAFGFMLLVVLIVVLGSLWIMYHLNYHMMMSPTETAKYLNDQNSL
jgi:cytochrome o ubiquinol oxidase operon protein cyoD